MSNHPPNRDKSPFPRRIAAALCRFGGLAFWLQIVLGIIPIGVLLFAVFVLHTSTKNIRTIIELFLAYGCLLFLFGSGFFSFRYLKLGQQLNSTTRPISVKKIKKTLETGILINLIGMIISVIVALGSVGTMLITVLTLPPGAVVIESSQWIVPLDVVWLQALMNTIAAQVVGITVSLWLINQVNKIDINLNIEDTDPSW